MPHFDRARLLYSQSRLPQAEAELRQALLADPTDAHAHALLAMCLTDQERRDEAEREAREAVHRGPDEPFSHYAHAYVLLDRHRPAEAVGPIAEAIRLDPHNPSHHGLAAAAHFTQKHWQDALDAAERGLAIEPDHVQCANLRAQALVQLGRRADAHGTLEGLLAKAPENAVAHANRGWALLHAGQPTPAMESFREALRLDPTSEWARLGIVEAMKARNIVYRVLLKFFLAMSRLTGRGQWIVIIGLYILFRVLNSLAAENPRLAPFILPFLVLYVAFALMTWIAGPLFNLVLFTSRFGRQALSSEEKWSAGGVGLLLLAAIACLVVAFAADSVTALVAAASIGLLTLPFSTIFKCHTGGPRNTVIAYTVGMTLLATAAIALSLAESPSMPQAMQLYFVALFIFFFVGNAAAMSRPRR